ncbi:Actin-related protein 2/3 complex subunit 3 [Asimina triloba]
MYHSTFVNEEGIAKACGCPLLPLKSHVKGPAPISEQGTNDVIDEAITFFRANIFFRNFNIQSSADKLLIYLTLYINIALKRLEGCRTLAEGTKAIINLGLEKVPVPGEPDFPLGSLFALPQSRQEAGTIYWLTCFCPVKEGVIMVVFEGDSFVAAGTIQEFSEAAKRGNKREIIEPCLPTKWHSKQMVVGICKEEIHQYHSSFHKLMNQFKYLSVSHGRSSNSWAFEGKLNKSIGCGEASFVLIHSFDGPVTAFLELRMRILCRDWDLEIT